MKMKKATALLMSLLMAASVCACSVSVEMTREPAEASKVNTVTESSIEASQEESTPESTAESSLEASEPLDDQSEPQESSAESSQPVTSGESGTVQVSEDESRSSSSPESSTPREVSTRQESKPEQVSAQQSREPVATEVTGIALSPTSINMYVGETRRLNVNITPANAADRSFTYNWTDDSVISVSSDGTVRAKAAGQATITAETKNGKSASCTVRVSEKPAAPEPQQPQQSSKAPAPAPQRTDSSSVGAHWFDDAVFVGDSVTLKLSYYADGGSLGNADFLCAGSLGYNNALWDLNRSGNVHPLYRGRKYTVDEGVRVSGKKKVFIMLGMNDIGLYGVDGAVNGMIKLTDRIIKKSPDVQIYIQSVTPMLKNMQLKHLNNTTIPQFNSRLREICSEKGYIYLDVASAVSTASGDLAPENCSDPTAMGIHFTNKGCEKWVKYLKANV